ncbi:MAG: 3-oxoacid CoA-transferase subunit A [Chloroflexi bacterium]|nr:3-oxoacid CoA-transferase subunit A [Chloroflexota bacterium]
MTKRFASPDEAIHDVFGGARIMFGGFVAAGSPATLVAALVRRGTQGIVAIANNIGIGDNLDDLCERKQLSRMIASFAIRASSARESRFERLYRAGEVELELVPQGTLAERIRAGGAGIGGFFTPTGIGTVAAEGKETALIDGKLHVLEYPLRADFAFICAHQADEAGNLVYRGTSRNFNALMATAADVVIAEVQEIVPVGAIDPEHVVTPGIFVDRLVLSGERHVSWY